MGLAIRELLPDARPLVRRDVERVTGLDTESRVPGIDVSDDTVDPELAVAVRIAGRDVADRLGSHLAGPCLRPAEEHTLISGEAVDHRCFFAVQGFMIGVEAEREAA